MMKYGLRKKYQSEKGTGVKWSQRFGVFLLGKVWVLLMKIFIVDVFLLVTCESAFPSHVIINYYLSQKLYILINIKY